MGPISDTLGLFLNQFEAFCKVHQFTFSALAALGTLAAVVVSLGVALASVRGNRTRLRAVATVVKVVGAGINPENPPRYLVVDITNLGNLPLWVDWGFFNWRVPFSGEYGTVNPLDAYAIGIPGADAVPEVVRYPAQVQPRSTRRFRLSTLEVFQQNIQEDVQRHKWAPRWRVTHQRAVIWSADQRRFRVKLAKSVKRQLAKAGNA